ncbi:MAG: Stp1/IreP family PP2C-type Ser/Thr phosphatase [Gemmatimonadaceae bacterium]
MCGRTDVGRTREHNEDAFLVADVSAGAPLPQEGVTGYPAADRGLLFMVADGMGGAAAGEIASAMAVHTVLEAVAATWRNNPTRSPAGFARALRESAEEANRRIHATALEQPEYRGMGTTATVAGLLGDTLYLAQVGDSRAYIVRDGQALQITKDQSLLQRLVEAGEMTIEEAERSARRNIILQALGPEANVIIDLTHQTVRRGDVLILCSDGLSGLVRGEEIARVATEAATMDEICERLIDAANENGGPDNITVVAVRLDGEGLLPAAASDAVGHQRFAEEAGGGDDDWINGTVETINAPPPFGGYAITPPNGVPRAERPAVVLPQPGPGRQEKGRMWMAVLGILLVMTAAAALWRWLR